MNYRVLLYYHYGSILYPESVVEEHLAYCQSLGLRGRIYIAPEGINGTVSGTTAQVDTYIAYMQDHPLFQGWSLRSMKLMIMRSINCT
jgi:UPF0176 protein